MNINIFFVFIIIGLAMIFFLFKPIDITQQKVSNMPLLEIENFKITELDKKGLLSVSEGFKGIKYIDRYTVENLNYTDNTKKYLSNIRANNGTYKGNLIELSGDVVYSREDGFSLQTQNANFNEKTKVVNSTSKYISHFNGNEARGSSIQYDTTRGIVKSKNIVAKYKIKERKL